MYMNQSIYVWFMDLFILRSFVQNAELPPLAGATTIAYAFSNVSNDEEVWVIIRYKYYMWIT